MSMLHGSYLLVVCSVSKSFQEDYEVEETLVY